MIKYTIHVPHFVADNQGYPTSLPGFNILGEFREGLFKGGVTGLTVVSKNSFGVWTDGENTIFDHQDILEIVCERKQFEFVVRPLLETMKVRLNQKSLWVTAAYVEVVDV